MLPFVQSRKIESVLVMSKQYRCLPSEILGIKDDYTAFCFNEACSYIIIMLQEGHKPHYTEVRNKWKEEQKTYSNFKDFYKQYGG